MFSGLNLGLFYLNRLQLEIEEENGNRDAKKILRLRRDSNWLLATILWGNVSVNVLLTLLTDSVLTPAMAFALSTFGITIFGEILPQAYFSRHALKVGALLSPVIRVYMLTLYPVSKPTAMLLDVLVGPEGPDFFKEREFSGLLERHISSQESDIGQAEGQGALNFLRLDDQPLYRVGQIIDPRSIVELPIQLDLPIIPEWTADPRDPFIAQVQASGKKWVILIGPQGEPRLTLNADWFVRDVLGGRTITDPYRYCHRPIVVRDENKRIGEVLPRFYVEEEHKEDKVIDNDLILVWGENGKRIITGADILGSLLQGIVGRRKAPYRPGDDEWDETAKTETVELGAAQPQSSPRVDEGLVAAEAMDAGRSPSGSNGAEDPARDAETSSHSPGGDADLERYPKLPDHGGEQNPEEETTSESGSGTSAGLPRGELRRRRRTALRQHRG
jgi:hypothetical protein